jgi:hypothetical protein
MPTVRAEFDGRVFVPRQQVQLPVGTPVEVVWPKTVAPPTPEESRQWQEILQEIASRPPAFATVEDALRYSRKLP